MKVGRKPNMRIKLFGRKYGFGYKVAWRNYEMWRRAKTKLVRQCILNEIKRSGQCPAEEK